MCVTVRLAVTVGGTGDQSPENDVHLNRTVLSARTAFIKI
jgi:hypothetical protein